MLCTLAHSGRRTAIVLVASALVALALSSAVAAQVCVGDCSRDGEVTVNELIAMVNVALGAVEVSACTSGDTNSDGAISINEIITGVNNALNGCTATPTPTPTGGPRSYVGDYHGTAANYGVRFHVAADGAADGFLDFLGAASVVARAAGAADVLVSYAASGQANLATGAYQLGGNFFGNDFAFTGQLPDSPSATGTLSVTVFGTTSQGTLSAGTGPTATPTPGCDSANLQMTFSGVSADFNGTASDFAVARMHTAVEQVAPDYIAGLHEAYNSTFNGSECTQPRNIQIEIFEVLGGLAAGQSIPVSLGGSTGAGALVSYGQEAPGGDSVWSASAGTVFVDAVNGSVVTLRVVGAAMTEAAGAATGRFTLDVSGQVNTFLRQ
jgi:hypothetical protein